MKTVLLHIGHRAHEVEVPEGQEATDAATNYLLGLDYAPGFDWVADSYGFSMRRGETIYNNPNIANGSQKVWLNIPIKNPVGRPSKPTERMSFALEPELVPKLEKMATAAGFIHKRSGKPNLSAFLNEKIKEM